MAMLFEKSASWRRLVAATRNPRVMAAFTAASVAAAAGVAVATQSVTDSTGGAASTAAASATVARDWEAARYAAHSKRALGVLFDDVRGPGEGATAGSGGGAASAAAADGGGGGGSDGGGGGGRAPAAIDYRAIKLPGVAWHPAVAAKEKAAKEKAAKEVAAKELAGKELAAKEALGRQKVVASAGSSAAAVVASHAQGQTTPAADVARVGSAAAAPK